MKLGVIEVRISFPALDALVAFLRERDAAQGQVDAVTGAVREVVAKLSAAQTDLAASIQQNKP